MKQTKFDVGSKKPDIEVNKPEKPSKMKFWRRPDVALVMYVLFFIAMIYVWQYSSGVAQTEIPYSQFLQYLDRNQVENAVVSDNLISGKLTINDPKTGKPRSFVTVPLQNNALAQLLQQHGVQYTV